LGLRVIGILFRVTVVVIWVKIRTIMARVSVSGWG